MTHRKQTGSQAVEFALVLPFMILIIFAVLDFAFLAYNKAVITNASREGGAACHRAHGRHLESRECGAGRLQLRARAPSSTWAPVPAPRPAAAPPTRQTVTPTSTPTFAAPITVTVQYASTGFSMGSWFNLGNGDPARRLADHVDGHDPDAARMRSAAMRHASPTRFDDGPGRGDHSCAHQLRRAGPGHRPDHDRSQRTAERRRRGCPRRRELPSAPSRLPGSTRQLQRDVSATINWARASAKAQDTLQSQQRGEHRDFQHRRRPPDRGGLLDLPDAAPRAALSLSARRLRRRQLTSPPSASP